MQGNDNMIGLKEPHVHGISVLYIGLGRYIQFWKAFYNSCERHFLNGVEKHYFVFTDSEHIQGEDDNRHIRRVYQENLRWPNNTLLRFQMFLKQRQNITKQEYAVFFNANIIFLKDIPLSDILLDEDQNYFACIHPGFASLDQKYFTLENNPQSTAYIDMKNDCPRHYFAGAFQGGRSTEFLSACELLQQNILKDKQRGIIAVWHDESHWNHFLHHRVDVKILSGKFLSQEQEEDNRLKKDDIRIFLLSKNYRGGYNYWRGQSDSQNIQYKIIIRMQGGLGNQLWQYFAGLALYEQYSNGKDLPILALDVSWYNDSFTDEVFLLKDIFPEVRLINDKYNNVTDISGIYHYFSNCFDFNEEFLSLPPEVVLEGSFQHNRYFEMAKSQLKPQLRNLPREYQELQRDYNLVALHVSRREDLSENYDNSLGIVPLSYYFSALHQLQTRIEKCYILIFSNDLMWAQESLVPYIVELGLPYAFPDGTAVEDLSLMVQCKHFIIGNSSLGAAAALLGATDHSIVYTPLVWHKSKNILSETFLPCEWQAISYPFYKGPPPDHPVCSVIIPVYNVKNYLNRCLDSVCLQTESNIEIIIIDDASPDGSWQVIEEYAKRDSRIVAIRHEVNKHLGGARNTGIDIAKGDWILFLDSDDYLDRSAIHLLLKQSKKYPCTEVIHYRWIDLNTKGDVIDSESLKQEDVTLIKNAFEHFCNVKKPIVWHSACLNVWKRDFLIRNEFRFPENTSIEDFAVFPQWIYQLQSPILYLPKRLYYYQKRPESIMNNPNRQINSMIHVVNILYNWSLTLDEESMKLIHHRISHEMKDWLYVLDEKQGNILLQNIPNYFIWQLFHKAQADVEQVRKAQADVEQVQIKDSMIYTDRWYSFGRLSRKRKLWVIGKVLSKKLCLYRILFPFARIIKYILRKGL